MATLGLLAPALAAAHGDAASAVPDAPGGRIGLSAAVTTLNASALLPSARLGGYLLQGDPGVDRRGLGLEHGVADIGWRFNDTLGAQLAVGKHGTDKAHVEAAWLQGRWRAGPDDWQLGAGRQRPELGPVMTTTGHLDRFALVPLAKRLAVNDDWIDDGVQLGWRREGPDRRVSVDVGLWRGAVFPGAASGAVVPALHAGVAAGDWTLDGFVARFQPKGRGARVSSFGGGHTHVAPRCDAALTQVLCFDGTVDLAGASVRWDSHQWPVSASAAGWLRRDRGTLSSANGEARYQGRNLGSWVDAVWRFHPKAEAGVRLERIQADHTLAGPGATLLASEAGFNAYQPARRAALMLGWRPTETVDLRVEAGRESVAGATVHFMLLRLVARKDFLFPAGR